VLDIDSDQLNDFTSMDARYLEQVMRLVEKFL
jgi:putative methionine-R-sulfoxide reductase with GAF domain